MNPSGDGVKGVTLDSDDLRETGVVANETHGALAHGESGVRQMPLATLPRERADDSDASVRDGLLPSPRPGLRTQEVLGHLADRCRSIHRRRALGTT